jgi:hypothetical protein
MKISFCTTCMGRGHHLKETLLRNIRDNPPSDGVEKEFVVLAYGRKDDTVEYMLNNLAMRKRIESGLVKFAFYPDAEKFHHSHAKNMAHVLATGDILCNLDADNYTGPGFAQFLASAFQKQPNGIAFTSPKVDWSRQDENERGSYGRIAVSRNDFMRLGGYRESYRGYGAEDKDFIRRALVSGMPPVTFSDHRFMKVIPHSNIERVQNTVAPDKLEALHTASIFQKLHKKFERLAFPTRIHNNEKFAQGVVYVGLEQHPVDTTSLPAERAEVTLKGYFNYYSAAIAKEIGVPVMKRVIEALHLKPYWSEPGSQREQPYSSRHIT